MSLIEELDYGTPRSKSTTMVTLTIDGKEVTVPEGTSIMRAAMDAGHQIPKLCATDMVDAFGSCRLCVVEIEGRAGTPASCTTPAMNGLVVHTQSERLKKLRKGVMELYISDHPLDCLTCGANGDCELQDMAGAVGLRDVRYGYEGENHVFAKSHGEVKAEMRGEEVVRMVPYKDGKANRGHSCVKGRFAWGYTNHKERILKPMIRERIEDPWREVSWDDAFSFAATKMRSIQKTYGRDAI